MGFLRELHKIASWQAKPNPTQEWGELLDQLDSDLHTKAGVAYLHTIPTELTYVACQRIAPDEVVSVITNGDGQLTLQVGSGYPLKLIPASQVLSNKPFTN